MQKKEKEPCIICKSVRHRSQMIDYHGYKVHNYHKGVEREEKKLVNYK